MASPPNLFDYNTNIDSVQALNMSRELVSMLAIDAAGAIVNNSKQTVYNTSFPGYTRDDLSSMEQVIENMDKTYRSMLTQTQQTNNLLNLNNYVDSVYTNESARVNHLKNESVNNVYKMRQEYMTSKYNVAHTQFIIKLLMFTFVVVIVCASLAFLTQGKNPMISMRIALCVALTLLCFFVLIAGLYYRRALERRKDDWTKFYFKAPASANNAGGGGSCP